MKEGVCLAVQCCCKKPPLQILSYCAYRLEQLQAEKA